MKLKAYPNNISYKLLLHILVKYRITTINSNAQYNIASFSEEGKQEFNFILNLNKQLSLLFDPAKYYSILQQLLMDLDFHQDEVPEFPTLFEMAAFQVINNNKFKIMPAWLMKRSLGRLKTPEEIKEKIQVLSSVPPCLKHVKKLSENSSNSNFKAAKNELRAYFDQTIEFLTKNITDNFENKDHFRPLIEIASAFANKTILEEIINAVTAANPQENVVTYLSGALTRSCMTGNLECAKFIIRLLTKAKVNNFIDDVSYDKTPLHFAVLSGNNELLALLIQNKADIARKDKEGRNSLHFACIIGNYEAAQLLLNENSELLDHLDKWGSLPIHNAFQSKNADLVLFLISLSSAEQLIMFDNQKRTALHLVDLAFEGQKADQIKEKLIAKMSPKIATQAQKISNRDRRVSNLHCYAMVGGFVILLVLTILSAIDVLPSFLSLNVPYVPVPIIFLLSCLCCVGVTGCLNRCYSEVKLKENLQKLKIPSAETETSPLLGSTNTQTYANIIQATASNASLSINSEVLANIKALEEEFQEEALIVGRKGKEEEEDEQVVIDMPEDSVHSSATSAASIRLG